VFGTLLILDFVIVFEYTFIEPQMLFYFYNELGWTTVQFGVVIATSGVAIVVGQALLGRWSDKVGRKPIIVLGALLFTSLPAALAFVTWFPLMMMLAATAGLGLALIMPALSAFYIDITSEQHRSKIHGIKSSAASLGGVLGPLLLMGATTVMEPRGVFISSGALLAVTAVLALVVLREPSRARGDATELEWDWSGARATVAQATLRGIVARASSTRQRAG
jgi:MFS family permease